MALRKDKNYRGPHASHVRRHSKLLKHRTVIDAAFPLLDWLVCHSDVKSVSLGKLVHASGKLFTRRVEHTIRGGKFRLLLVAPEAAQVLQLRVKSADSATKLLEEIRKRWMKNKNQ